MEGTPIGRRLRRIRESQGVSREVLAELSDVALNTIGLIETGVTKNPGMKTLTKLADALGVATERFLSDVGDDIAELVFPWDHASIKGKVLSDEQWLTMAAAMEQSGVPESQITEVRERMTRHTLADSWEVAFGVTTLLQHEIRQAKDLESVPEDVMRRIERLAKEVVRTLELVRRATALVEHLPELRGLPDGWRVELERARQAGEVEEEDSGLGADPLTVEEFTRGIREGTMAAEDPELDDEADTD